MKQLNIWGGEDEVKDINKKKTIKDKFRERYRYINGKTCGECDNLAELPYHGKVYFKCPYLGLTQSQATDIRKKDKACRLFK